MLGQHPLSTLRTNVGIVTAAGGTVPDTYTHISDRWDQYLNLGAGHTTVLADAITTPGNTTDLARLRALALAEYAGAPDQVGLTNELRGPVFLALRDAYQPAAEPNYQLLAEQFNTTATAFTKAVTTTDPDQSAEQMVTQPDKARRAWTDAAILAAQLDQQLPVLRAAADLAGLTIRDSDGLLPLTCDTAGLHRRRVWEAWETNTGRTTRWGALRAAGINIRAADLDGYEHYRRPAPLEVKYIRDGYGHRPVQIDPEDEHV